MEVLNHSQHTGQLTSSLARSVGAVAAQSAGGAGGSAEGAPGGTPAGGAAVGSGENSLLGARRCFPGGRCLVGLPCVSASKAALTGVSVSTTVVLKTLNYIDILMLIKWLEMWSVYMIVDKRRAPYVHCKNMGSIFWCLFIMSLLKISGVQYLDRPIYCTYNKMWIVSW